MPDPVQIVLTGGPCGGKTTALSRISERLESFGHRVFRVPEMATMLFQAGLTFDDLDELAVRDAQELVVRAITRREAMFRDLANLYYDEKPAVILCDRSAMDVKAYVSEQVWKSVMSYPGYHEATFRDKHHAAVIHMVTAADGALDAYTTENNSARTETPDQARELDQRTQAAWVGHPHLRVIDNSTGFEEKVRRAVAAICRVLGIPDPVEDERKFLVGFNPNVEIPVPHYIAEIEQTYLLDWENGTEPRVRQRGRDGGYVYTHTVKRRVKAGRAFEVERVVDPREYLVLMQQRDETRETIAKDRACFVWKGQYFELDTYKNVELRDPQLQVLEVEVADLHAPVHLPPWLEVLKEVTDDPTYSNYNLARRIVESVD